MNQDMTEQVEQAIEAGFWHIDTAQGAFHACLVIRTDAVYFQPIGMRKAWGVQYARVVWSGKNFSLPGNISREMSEKFSNPVSERCAFQTFIGYYILLFIIYPLIWQLGVTYLDLYLVHAPPLYPGGIEKVWRDFEKLKADGLAKY